MIRGSFGVLALGSALLLKADDLAARVVVLANSRQAESVQLAEFYLEQRGVPAANLIALPLPSEESITWRQFIDQVYQPVQDELYRRGWIDGTNSNLLDGLGRRRYALTGHHLSYLVVCRGVPLRIYNDPTLLSRNPPLKIAEQFNKNEAAVDSELSLLAMSGYETTAMIANPLFAQDGMLTLDAQQIIKVSRLDGPTWESSRQLITSALEAEETGLLGRTYVDLKGPHADGDQWLESVQRQLQDLGFDGDTENTGAVMDVAARFDAPILYFGWYTGSLNGPFARSGFTFPPGAIALHIHSFSAQTLHSDTSDWCGPLVARGVTATLGNVFEPFLQLTHRPNLLLRALSQGRNFGDAAYYALPVLSWEAVAIGDPLYRPFKVTLAEQLAPGKILPAGLAPYALIRQANLLVQKSQKAEAVLLLRNGLREQPDLALGLALAKMLLADHDDEGAVRALVFLTDLKQCKPGEWPLVREAAMILVENGAAPSALRLFATLAQSPAPSPGALHALLTVARQTADAAGDVKMSLEFSRQLAELISQTPKS